MPNNKPEIPREDGFYCESIYGNKAKAPLVKVTWQQGDTITTGTMPCETARELASNLLQSAEAAEQDGFIVEWAQTVVGVDFMGAVSLMNEYWRAARQK